MSHSGFSLLVFGLVQGVGFRPLVFALAREFGLAGWVRNEGGGARIFLRARREEVEAFISSLRSALPPQARIDEIEIRPISPQPLEKIFFKNIFGEGGVQDESKTSPAEGGSEAAPQGGGCQGGPGGGPPMGMGRSPAQAGIEKAPQGRGVQGGRSPALRTSNSSFSSSIFKNTTSLAEGFYILSSASTPPAAAMLADLAICEECRGEFSDPANRRYAYPFITCALCGPRFSIIRALPYDRANTSMAELPLCEDCLAEYHNPLDRRFHAQPLSCPRCAIPITLKDPAGALLARDGAAVEAAAEALRRGEIVAFKGLGGFHLLADALNPAAITRLRTRKNRPKKPLALLCADLAMASSLAQLSPAEEAILKGPLSPIVLLKKKNISPVAEEAPQGGGVQGGPEDDVAKTSPAGSGGAGGAGGRPPDENEAKPPPCQTLPNFLKKENLTRLSEALDLIAPGSATLGIMLAYTPLQLLLFSHFPRPLIATSANVSGEGIIYREEELFARLGGVFDLALNYEREITNPSDDSLVALVGGEAVFLRASRGAAPEFVKVPRGDPGDVCPAGSGGEAAPQGRGVPGGSGGRPPDKSGTQSLPADPQSSSSCSNQKNKKNTILALGSELKNHFALYFAGQILISPFIGDLKSPSVRERFFDLLDFFIRTYELKITTILADKHPHFAYVDEVIKKYPPEALEKIQHHYAHFCSAYFEGWGLGSEAEVLGLIFDGTGYGDDGSIWGGELLVGNLKGYRRVGHFETLTLINADITNIANLALAALWHYGLGEGEFLRRFPHYAGAKIKNLKLIHAQSQLKSSSAGRIIDAAGAMILGLERISYEAQVGLELEGLYEPGLDFAYPLSLGEGGVIDFRSLIQGAARDEPVKAATGLINGFADLIIQVASHWTQAPQGGAAAKTSPAGERGEKAPQGGGSQEGEAKGPAGSGGAGGAKPLPANSLFLSFSKKDKKIILSGGVFQNKTLLEILRGRGLDFHLPKRPANDGGIALGQLGHFLAK